jgi:hydrogenase maturation protein HypF
MSAALEVADWPTITVEIRLRGASPGSWLQPAVWRLARDLGMNGEVLNDGEGMLLRASGDESAIGRLLDRLHETPRDGVMDDQAARTLAGRGDGARPSTILAPDTIVCPACTSEVLDPFARRFRYPFTNCAECGPRFSIATAAAHDRAATTMEAYVLCPACRAECADHVDRRFHAETVACHICGPQARLVRCDGKSVAFERFSTLDECDAVGALLQRGHIVAIKGVGGYQLACDATNGELVARLRAAKQQETLPLAMMARDLDVIRRYAAPTGEEERLLRSAAGPIVLLTPTGESLPEAVAPSLKTIGLMLPPTPLHLMVLRKMERPVVMTSGNAAGEPQIVDDREALACLGEVAEFALTHDRPVAMRVDDSVARVMDGAPRVLRRGRGYAPEAIDLPDGVADAPDLLALGGDRKNAFCLVSGRKAILSPHIGDLDDALTVDEYRNSIAEFARLFHHRPTAIAVDGHPEYRSSRLGRVRAKEGGVPLIEIQHHHAHLASCLVECGRPLDAPPVLGIVLDGGGWGGDGSFWGGEFLHGDYRRVRRLAALKPIATAPRDSRLREPWRDLYAHLSAAIGWDAVTTEYPDLALWRALSDRRGLVETAHAHGSIAETASCGRLFEAVAAALGLCSDRQGYDGEAAARLEALAGHAPAHPRGEDRYRFDIASASDRSFRCLEPRPMWRALLDDLARATPAPIIAARFHHGLAAALADMTATLAGDDETWFDTVALSGGCFQNKLLFEETARRLREVGLTVLTHARVPPNDGGLALGQAAIAAARLVRG